MYHQHSKFVFPGDREASSTTRKGQGRKTTRKTVETCTKFGRKRRGEILYISIDLEKNTCIKICTLSSGLYSVHYIISSGLYYNYIITLRIHALSLAESHDLLEDRRTELRHRKPYPIAFPYLYRSCTRDICKISTFSNFQMFGWIKSKLLPTNKL
jgi:hypothetical protein